MTTDLERRLAEAADDTDRPLHLSVDDLVHRGRRSVRRRRIAAIASATGAAVAVVATVNAWPTHQADPAPVAGTPTSTVTIDVKTGKELQPAPPVSPLTDDAIRERCATADHSVASWDKSGPIDSAWDVVLKTGVGERFYAVLLSPDHSVAAGCEQEGGGHVSAARHYMENQRGNETLPRWTDSSRGPASLVTVVADTPDGKVRAGLVGREGFFAFGRQGYDPSAPKSLVRGYDAAGRQVLERRLVLPAS
ncbi:hypothetical protein [Kribbella sp. NPDC004875]|uniref:hypothetical protein n=1 Tax=Kribbella sp. NPDC004875 TaxID=3364107 RepID=UPI003690CBEC